MLVQGTRLPMRRFQTLDLVRKEFPELSLCLSTNGLALAENVDRLKGSGVDFITVTMNAIDPEVGAKIIPLSITMAGRCTERKLLAS